MNNLLEGLAAEWSDELGSLPEVERSYYTNTDPSLWSYSQWRANFYGRVDRFYVSQAEYESEVVNIGLPQELRRAIDECATLRPHDYDDIEVIVPRDYAPSSPLPQDTGMRWLDCLSTIIRHNAN